MNETHSTTLLLLARPAVDRIRAADASVMSTTYFLIPELPARGPPAEHGGQLDTVGARQRRTFHGCTMELSALKVGADGRLPRSRASLVAAASAFFFSLNAFSSSVSSAFSFLGAFIAKDRSKDSEQKRVALDLEWLQLSALSARHYCSCQVSRFLI